MTNAHCVSKVSRLLHARNSAVINICSHLAIAGGFCRQRRGARLAEEIAAPPPAAGPEKQLRLQLPLHHARFDYPRRRGLIAIGLTDIPVHKLRQSAKLTRWPALVFTSRVCCYSSWEQVISPGAKYIGPIRLRYRAGFYLAFSFIVAPRRGARPMSRPLIFW